MFNKIKPFVVVFLALSGLALLGCSLAWAQQPPKAQEIIYSDGGEGNAIKVKYNPQGDVTAVYFWDDTCTPDPTNDCWDGPIPAQKGVICTCVGSECSDDLDYNLANQSHPDITLDCREMKNSGPQSTGCPLLGSLGFTISGQAYTRSYSR
jgi:hypothetical protein